MSLRSVVRTLSTLPLLFCLGGQAAACSPARTILVAAPVAPAATASASPTAGRARTLVWTHGSAGTCGDAACPDEPVTYELSDDGDVLAKVPGIRVAAAGTEWTWEEGSEAVQTEPCEGPFERPPGEGRATRVRLVPADPGRRPIELVVPPDVHGANEVDHSARLLASVGPLLFVEESTYAYACGAHGNSEVRFRVWNVEDGAPLDLLSEIPDRDRLVAAGKTAIDEDADGPDFSTNEDPPTLTELLPRVGPRGRLEASALVSVPSCYACTSGGWSSYTTSASVPVDPPERLRKLGPVPAAAQRFAATHPAVTIAGYSTGAAAGVTPAPAAGSRPAPPAAAQSIDTSSTSKIRPALGGMLGGLPLSP